jgi:hypothetical protein
MKDNVLTPYLLAKWEIYFKGLLIGNRECYLGEQETELEGMNETGIDKITLDIEIVKWALKPLKSNTSCGVERALADLLNSRTEKII